MRWRVWPGRRVVHSCKPFEVLCLLVPSETEVALALVDLCIGGGKKLPSDIHHGVTEVIFINS